MCMYVVRPWYMVQQYHIDDHHSLNKTFHGVSETRISPSVQVLAQSDAKLITTLFPVSAGRGPSNAVVKAIDHAAWPLSFRSRAACWSSCGAEPTADLESSSCDCDTVIHQYYGSVEVPVDRAKQQHEQMKTYTATTSMRRSINGSSGADTQVLKTTSSQS